MTATRCRCSHHFTQHHNGGCWIAACGCAVFRPAETKPKDRKGAQR